MQPLAASQSRCIADIFSKDIFIAISDILPIYWRYTAMAVYRQNIGTDPSFLSPLQSKAVFTSEFISRARVLSNHEIPYQALKSHIKTSKKENNKSQKVRVTMLDNFQINSIES